MSALAWPAVALAALVFFGREARKWLAEQPSRVKVGLAEVEWNRQASRVEVSLDRPGNVADPAADQEAALEAWLTETLSGTADADPLVAIMEASQAVRLCQLR